jgi:hypothetical protein
MNIMLLPLLPPSAVIYADVTTQDGDLNRKEPSMLVRFSKHHGEGGDCSYSSTHS